MTWTTMYTCTGVQYSITVQYCTGKTVLYCTFLPVQCESLDTDLVLWMTKTPCSVSSTAHVPIEI